MPAISIEEAVNQNCEAIMAGDLMRAANDFTPEALANVMAIGAAMTAMPSFLGYSIESHNVFGEDHLIDIAFRTTEGEFRARATWRDVDGYWRIAGIDLAGV